MEMFFVVLRTTKPADIRGATWSRAEFISLE